MSTEKSTPPRINSSQKTDMPRLSDQSENLRDILLSNSKDFNNESILESKDLEEYIKKHYKVIDYDKVEVCEKCEECEIIEGKILKKFWTATDINILNAVASELNYAINIGMIDSEPLLINFLAQCLAETGINFVTSEDSFAYDADGLKRIFPSYYKKHPEEAVQDGGQRIKLKKGGTVVRGAKHQTIANKVYGNKNGNKGGNDGWNFRGRGMIHITGRDKYEPFTKYYDTYWEDKNPDFVNNPDLVASPVYAVRSALWYWVSLGAYVPAKDGISTEISNDVTNVVNRWTDTKEKRKNNARVMFASKVFKNICYNTKPLLNNPYAKDPIVVKVNNE